MVNLGAVSSQATTHFTLLARLSAGGDAAAWLEFCDRYEELIRGFARRRGLTPSEWDDVVQDVMLALTKAMPGFAYDPAKGKFRSYLKTITMHAISRKWRQNHAETRLLSKEGASTGASDVEAESVWETEWRQYHLRSAMKTIKAEFNPTDLAAFDAYALAGQEAGAVAAQFGISVDAVYQAKSRVLRRLSEVIAKQVEEEG